MLSRRHALAGLAWSSLLGCRGEPRPTDEPIASTDPGVLIHANIRTNNPAQPIAEAMLVRDGVIVAIGSRAELDDPRARRLDWRDATVIPGLTDAHAHLQNLGQSREIVDLRGATSVEEVVARLQAGAPATGWVLGRSWDQNLWGGEMPTAAMLDRAFGDRPVWLRRVDGHAGWANSVTLALAGIDESTPEPEGGEILRSEPVPGSPARSPTGVLIDTAMDLVPVPAPTAVEIERWLRAATREAASLGLTGVHDMGIEPETHVVFEALDLPIRVHGYISEAWLLSTEPLPTSRDRSKRYTVEGVKLYADGALGSRGAAMIEPYSDRPGHLGALIQDPQRLFESVRLAHERGLQVATHAIGDRGIRSTLHAYERVRGLYRPRIEHVQILDLDDLPKLLELGVIASMQPTHATSDMPWAEARVGPDRIAGAYAWRSILTATIPLAFGSDFPVEQPSPLLGLYAAVTREDLDGQPPGGWLPDQRLTIAEAIAAFTSGAAYAADRDGELGRLEPGYRADLTCLVGDPFVVEPNELPNLAVRATMVDGALSYEA